MVRTPITGEEIGRVARTDAARGGSRRSRAPSRAFEAWRDVPGPRRGELVRLLGEELRREKETLGALVTLEVGKIAPGGLGEVQEMIDIATSRSVSPASCTDARSRRSVPALGWPRHWHPLGPAGRHHRVQLSASPSGAGTPRWRSSAATPCSGSRPIADAADRDRDAGALPACCGALRRRARWARRARRRRRRPCPPARRRPAHPARLGHRVDADGQGDRAANRVPARAVAARARREQRGGRRAERRPRPRRQRRAVRGCRHRRPAMHEPAPADRARVDRGRARRAAGNGLGQERPAEEGAGVGTPTRDEGTFDLPDDVLEVPSFLRDA